MTMASGLYIHIPFCRSKCIYCDFYSTPAMSKMAEVVDGLISEFEFRRHEIPAGFSTIYIGGGTPSVLPPQLLGKLAAAVMQDSVEEFTMEVNPEDVSEDNVIFWKSIGVNRISMGVQSLRDDILQFIGRRHSASRALEAIDILYRCGISNISADLIYGLPGLSNEQWAEDVATLMSTSITHLSAYCLTFHERTKLYRMMKDGRVAPADDETVAWQFDTLRELAAKSGFEHYEISNLARPGFRSRHNSAYWNPANKWLGIGPSAHSFDGNTRRIDDCRISSWLERLPFPCDDDEEDAIDRVNDNIVTALRTIDGLPVDSIPEEKRGELLSYAKPHLQSGSLTLTDEGRLVISPGHWLVSDGIIRDLILLHE